MDREVEKKLAQYDVKRRRIEKIVFVVMLFVFLALLVVEYMIFDFRSTFSLPYNLLYFMLLNVNVILIFLLLFLVFRNLAKLLFERRARILGSKLRTKLIVAFATFALVPTVAFFYVAVTFITNSMDRWFSIQVEGSLSESLEVAQAYYEAYEGSALFFSKQMAQGVAHRVIEDELSLSFPNPTLESYLTDRRAEYNVDAVDIYILQARLPDYTAGLVIAHLGLTREQKELLVEGQKGVPGSDTFEQKQGEMVWGVSPLQVNGKVLGALVVRYQIPESLLGRMRRILTAYEEYSQLQMMQDPIKTSYVVILVLITAFIFFGAIWFGFLLSRNMVGPIQELAEGTKLVAQGDLTVRIRARTKDEIGTLVDHFNTMTERLSEVRTELERTAGNLRVSNVELERRRVYMETVLGNITAGVISFDEAENISTINSSAETILAINHPNPVGKSLWEVFGGRFDKQIAQIMNALERNPDRTVVRQVDLGIDGGPARTLLVSISQIKNEFCKPAGTVLVLEDLTELVKAQRMAAWQDVARKIAHEIKNPLTPIQLAAQRLRKRYGGRFSGEEEVFLESTTTIIKQVEELRKMVDEFSNFARMAEPRPALHNANQILNEAAILYSEAHKNIRFRIDTDDALPQLYCDRDQLKRVFINIIDNAVASIEGRGTLQLQSWYNEQENAAVIEIEDNGCGLPKEYKDHLFEPYFSTRKMGTGLGLAIVHQIVTDLGGRIQLDDNKPRGTRVTIVLPIGPSQSDKAVSALE